MTATRSPLNARTADPVVRPLDYYDLSGTGVGPFSPTHVLIDSTGNPVATGNPLTVAATALPLPTGAAQESGNLARLAGTLTVSDTSGAQHASVYAQVIATGTATSLASLLSTASAPVIPTWAQFAFLTPENGSIRYRGDGTSPTAAVGQPVASGQGWPVQGQATLQALQIITAGGSVTLSVEFRG